MRIRYAAVLGLLAIGALSPAPARGDEVVIKLGTRAPNGSPWHTLLKEMGQQWAAASGGRVTLRIYPGGQVGNEGDMVKKMRVGQLQAAALTTIGLHDITPEPQAVDAPLLIDSWSTLDYVTERIAPKLEQALEQKGYVVLNWSEVGFVRFFSTKPFHSYEEYKQAKIFAWEGDPASVEAWRAGGFHPVVVSSTDITTGLTTGMIDTVALAPLFAFSSRIFDKAKYMLDFQWAVLTGATVVSKAAWDKVPADVRPKLLAIAHEFAKKLDAEVRRMETDSLETMKKQGLQVIHPDDPAAFKKAAEATYAVVRGKVVPAALFDEVKKLALEAHAKQGK